MEIINWVYAHSSFYDIPIALFILFILTSIHQKLTTNGPMLWPLMGILPSILFHINNLYDWATKSLIKSGGTFPYKGMFMGNTYGIITVNPSNIEFILKTKFNNFPKGKYYKERFNDLLGNGIFNSDHKLWKEQRRIAISEMHSTRFVQHSMQSMQDLVHQKLLKLIDIKLGNIFDLQEMLLRFTFDSICAAALGIDAGCLDIDMPEIPFAKAFEEATELTLFRFLLPPFIWKPMKFLQLGFEKRLKKSIKIVHDFAMKTVLDRRNEFTEVGNLNNHSDLLSRIMNNEGKNTNFLDNFLRDFCVSFILAGRDTTSVALTWFFWLINENPKVETKILSEINEILGHRNSENYDLNEVIFTPEEMKKMVYLHAALSESLRLYPSVPIDIKEVINDIVLPDGNLVKSGARVFYCVFSMARIESIWGKDCLEFKPERWIKDGKFMSENQFKFAVFNGGPRLCVGKKFAYLQMKMVAASMLLRYKIKVVDGHKVVPKVTTTLYMKHGLLVTLRPRLFKVQKCL